MRKKIKVLEVQAVVVDLSKMTTACHTFMTSPRCSTNQRQMKEAKTRFEVSENVKVVDTRAINEVIVTVDITEEEIIDAGTWISNEKKKIAEPLVTVEDEQEAGDEE